MALMKLSDVPSSRTLIFQKHVLHVFLSRLFHVGYWCRLTCAEYTMVMVHGPIQFVSYTEYTTNVVAMHSVKYSLFADDS